MVGSSEIVKRIDLIDEIGALRLVVEDLDSPNCKLIDQRAFAYLEEQFNESPDINEFLNALDEFSLFAHGSKSQKGIENIDRKFRQAISSLIDDLGNELREFSPSAAQMISEACKNIFDSPMFEKPKHIEELQENPDQVLEDLKHISSIQPPEVLRRILELCPSEMKDSLNDVFNSAKQSFSNLSIAAALVGLLGFNNDKRIQKANYALALKGAKSERNDVQHIAFALACDAFITIDKRSARKHYALSEYLDLSSNTLFVSSKGKVQLLSDEYWP